MESDAGKDGSRKRGRPKKGDDTLSNTNKPSAAALIRAQGQQIRREAAWEYLQRRCGLRGDADGDNENCSRDTGVKKDEILELDYILKNRWRDEGLIGNDVIFDYSKGYPMLQGVVGFDKEKYDRLQCRDQRRKEQLEQECEEIETFIENIDESLTRRIFRMCFVDGRRQKDVAKAVHLDRSRISRKIDSYLENAHKAQNAHV